MIRDEIIYGVVIIALALFAFWIMPRYEHMTSKLTVKQLMDELIVIQAKNAEKHKISDVELNGTRAILQGLNETTASQAHLQEIKKTIDKYKTELDGSSKTGSSKTGSSKVEELEKAVDEVIAENNKKHKLSQQDVAMLKAMIEGLKSIQKDGKELSDRDVVGIGKLLSEYQEILGSAAKEPSHSSSKLDSLNLTLPGPSDDYEPGPMGVESPDKYILKSSLVPTCTTCGQKGRNGYPTSTVPGDMDGSFADITSIHPNQYNLMNPDPWTTEEPPQPFLTSFASFMK